jgi:hypothetical protein
MDIKDMWQRLSDRPSDVPRAGVHQQTAAEGITISGLTQQCQTAIPLPNLVADEVTVTFTSSRLGQAAQVSVGANFNSLDGSYQGPTMTVGHGQFTATSSEVKVSFVVLPANWPLLGVGAQAVWEDGTQPSTALTYAELVCTWRWWWVWLIRVLSFAGLRPSD